MTQNRMQVCNEGTSELENSLGKGIFGKLIEEKKLIELSKKNNILRMNKYSNGEAINFIEKYLPIIKESSFPSELYYLLE